MLKIAGPKKDREEDLEIKLAIVLAENDKLIHVVNELHRACEQQKEELNRGQRTHQRNFEYEKRINEAISAMEEWKQKYDNLERSQMAGQVNTVPLQNTIKELQRENQVLTDRLARQDRDLETLRARFASFEGSPTKGKGHDQKVSDLTVENERLKRELDTMRLRYGDANALQLRLKDYDDKIRTLLDENEKLNRLLNEKMRELRNTRNVFTESPIIREFSIDSRATSAFKEHEKSAFAMENVSDNRLQQLQKQNNDLTTENERLNMSLRQMRGAIDQLQDSLEQQKRISGVREIERDSKMQNLMRENTELSNEIAKLNQNIRQMSRSLGDSQVAPEQLKDRLDLILKENAKLNHLLGNKVREIEELKSQLKDLPGGNVRIEQLNIQIGGLLGENRKLTETINEKSREIERLRLQLEGGSEISTKVDKLEEKIILISGENERLNKLVADKTR